MLACRPSPLIFLCFWKYRYLTPPFQRPGFQKLLEDVELGYVSTIIVKDMSRLGRDYLQVGYYTDSYFPDHNIRFIAVNDMVDSNEGENELAPFRNVMNELYARDISRKVRSAHRIRGNSGEPLSQPPYGYMKAPENRKKWIIDPEAAKVVQEIFHMALEGKGNETIARILQERKILNCTAYWQSKGIGRGGKKTQPNPYKWGKTAVEKILARQEYCGDVINFKTYSKSFKNKARLENAPENWVIFKNVHEPIIDRETFEQVQKLTGNTKRRAPKQENSEKVSQLYEKVYEDNAEGKISDEWFMQLSHKYEVERMGLKTKISDLRQKLNDLDAMQQNKDNFLSAVRKFMEMETLTAPLLRELIDRIEVHETEGTGKNRTQRIVIHYRFVGYIELPEDKLIPPVRAETRQGVAVQYLTRCQTA